MLTLEELSSVAPNSQQIYHYTNARTAIEHILFKRSLLFNSLSKTHDPLEFEDYMVALQPERPYSAEQLEEIIYMLSEHNRIFKESTKIACFSADFKDDGNSDSYSVFKKGYCRSRMWSQYADAHRGLCLIFHLATLLDRIKEQIKSRRDKGYYDIHFEADYINYNDALPGLSDLLSTDPAILNEISMMEFIEGNMKIYLFQKLEDYEHEQEYRICLYSEAFNSVLSFYVDYVNSLQGIILGCRFPEQYIINIKEYSKVQGLPVFQMSWENGYPKIFGI